MTQDEMAVKLAETEARSKSNTKRIDELKTRQDALDKLAESMARMDERQKTMDSNVQEIKDDFKEVKEDVKQLSEKPAKRWDKVVELLIAAAVGAFLSWIANGGLA